MATLDEVMAKARELLDIAGKKTGEVVEISKLKYSKMQIENELSKSYEKLGVLTYKAKKGNNVNDELVSLCITEIDDLIATLEGISQKIDETRNVVRCPKCGSTMPNATEYCSKCGAKLEEQQAEEPTDAGSDSSEAQ